MSNKCDYCGRGEGAITKIAGEYLGNIKVANICSKCNREIPMRKVLAALFLVDEKSLVAFDFQQGAFYRINSRNGNDNKLGTTTNLSAEDILDDFIRQIEMSDFIDEIGHNMKNNRAYIRAREFWGVTP